MPGAYVRANFSLTAQDSSGFVQLASVPAGLTVERCRISPVFYRAAGTASTVDDVLESQLVWGLILGDSAVDPTTLPDPRIDADSEDWIWWEKPIWEFPIVSTAPQLFPIAKPSQRLVDVKAMRTANPLWTSGSLYFKWGSFGLDGLIDLHIGASTFVESATLPTGPPTFVAASTHVAQLETVSTLNPPGGATAGQLGIAVLTANQGDAGFIENPPGTWTDLFNGVVGTSAIWAGWRVLTGDLNDPIIMTSSADGKRAGVMGVYSGFDPADPIDVIGTPFTRPGSQVNNVLPAIGTSGTFRKIVCLSTEKSSTASSVIWSPDAVGRAAGFTTGGGACSAALADFDLAAAGSTDAQNAAYNVASTVGWGVQLAINPVP